MKRWTVLLLLVGLAGPADAVAQDGWSLRVTPRAGLLTPADYFYEEFRHFGLDPLEWTEAFILRAPVFGLAAELEIAGTGVWIRGEVARTVDGIMSMRHAVLFPATGFDPPRVEKTDYRVATALTMGSLDLVFPTQLRFGPVQPYVTAGIGGKRYSFDTDPFLDLAERVVLPQPGVVPMANVGAGAVVTVLGATLDIQVRDALSKYWDRLQHDVMVLTGLTFRLR